MYLCKIRNEYSYTMELKALIAECTAYDFKVVLEEKKPKSWLKSVSAFANGLGGSLFFGIDNDGIVKGLDDIQHVCEEVMNLQGKELFSYKRQRILSFNCLKSTFLRVKLL